MFHDKLFFFVYFRMNSTFTSQELALFRKVIEAIVQSEDGSILITEAINMAFNLKQKMKIGESEALIDRLVQDGWLLQVIYPELFHIKFLKYYWS